jgi:aquaporin Z
MDVDNKKLLVEFVGSFFFIVVILNSMNDNKIGPHGIAIALLAVIYFGGNISGAHFNPAVTWAMILENKLAFNLGVSYIISQLSGAYTAYQFNSLVLKK